MKIKTCELYGAALDWAVAKCEGVEYRFMTGSGGDYNGNWWWETRRYSADWSQGGPIIDRIGIDIVRNMARGSLTAERNFIARLDSLVQCPTGGVWYASRTGSTKLIAAMRCFVASCLGDEVDVPDEIAWYR